MVRQFKGQDGRDKLQLRLDLGLLQMNLEGRPDGKQPHGYPSLYEYHLSRLDRHREAHDGADDGYVLEDEECGELQLEAVQYHHRYLCLLQIQDYAGVIRDTERNLQVFDFADRYAASDESAWSLQQFRPQLLMMRARARGSLAMRDGLHEECLALAQRAIQEIRTFFEDAERQDLIEASEEIRSLEHWLEELRGNRPISEQERLEMALKEAIQREDFERAAQFRDALRRLKQS